MYYRLKSGVLALRDQSGSSKKEFVRLAEGTVVQLVSAVRESGLVDVDREGAQFTLFYSDLLDLSFPAAPELDLGMGNSSEEKF